MTLIKILFVNILLILAYSLAAFYLIHHDPYGLALIFAMIIMPVSHAGISLLVALFLFLSGQKEKGRMFLISASAPAVWLIFLLSFAIMGL